MSVNPSPVITATRLWVQRFVTDLELCPFAQHAVRAERLRFTHSDARSAEELLQALQDELQLVQAQPEIETSLLIHPEVLQDFEDYNQFLDLADALLEDLELDGIFQVASFHPQYQFAGTQPEDAENFSNRSPYPLLHILREDSLDRAIATYPDVDQIPERNITRMNALGAERLRQLWQSCLNLES